MPDGDEPQPTDGGHPPHDDGPGDADDPQGRARSGRAVGGAVSEVVAGAFAGAVRRVGRWADSLDRADRVPVSPPEPEGPGAAASAWAVAKAAGVVATAPLSVPALAVAARRTANDCLERIDRYPDHLHALAAGRSSPLPAPRTLRLDAGRRWLITSDLHRCVPGRTDWPERQHTKGLYAHMLAHYAEQGWGLIENGDVEDFWMVGGSAWGAVYDIARIAGGVAAVFDDSMRLQLFAEQLDRTVDNNARTYRLVREGFLAEGRYHRTIGNHDEAYDDPVLVARLDEHLPGVDPVDTILLVDGDTGGARGTGAPATVQAVVSHGHLTDSWNGPGYSPLGRAITWLALGLDDLPTPAGSEGLPDEQAVDRLLGGRGRNRLVTLDPRFGGNRRFDSLDEERLFTRLAEAEPEEGWPWMLFGHTHYPMLWPLDAGGGAVRYANSGCGVLDHTVSALEWDPGRTDDPVHLVVWTDDGTGPRRVELVADGAALRVL